MKTKTAAVPAILAVILALFTRPAVAGDNDTHYVLTYFLARQVGYTRQQAQQIASANVSVDTDVNTEPLGEAKGY